MGPESGADMVLLAPAPALGRPGAADSLWRRCDHFAHRRAFERKTAKDENSNRGMDH
jgi:hypothetical protein